MLGLREIEKPTPRNNEVLVRNFAASVNFNDSAFVRGKPLLSRLWTGPFRPKHKILGTDIAGQVEAVGKNVTLFKPGDAVFAELGDGYGAFAEYTAVPESMLVSKPGNLNFDQAAAVPQAAITALQGLQKGIRIQPGQKVLINGASGGIGTFAVQIAKYYGAVVTGVCSTKNLNFVRSIGADHAIDYTHEDFTQNGFHYDLILDIVANRPTSVYMRVLTPRGTYVAVAFNPTTIFLGSIISKAGGKKARSLSAKPTVKDLAFIAELLETKIIAPIIDKRFPLRNVAEAIRYYESGTQGKVVISMSD